MFANASQLLFSASCQAFRRDRTSFASTQERRALGCPRLRLGKAVLEGLLVS